MKPPDAMVVPIPTDWGVFRAVFCREGLSRLLFPGAEAAMRREREAAWLREVREWAVQTEAALARALAGERIEVSPPLAVPPWATSFQRMVWNALETIPPGSVCSYGELARRLGRPGAARAVGRACGANPWPVLVPCHRVVTADGGLGGFSAGLHWKRRLLEVEGVLAADSSRWSVANPRRGTETGAAARPWSLGKGLRSRPGQPE